MKTTKLIIVLLATALTINAQSKMNEKRAMKEKHIDFTKEYLFFEIHGLIEIDGHIFLNDTCKSPIIFKATLDGIEIVDTLNKVQYVHKKCYKKGCNIVHLIKKEELIISPEPPTYWFNSDPDIRVYPNGYINLNDLLIED